MRRMTFARHVLEFRRCLKNRQTHTVNATELLTRRITLTLSADVAARPSRHGSAARLPHSRSATCSFARTCASNANR